MLTEDTDGDVPDALEEIIEVGAGAACLWPETPEFDAIADPAWEAGASDHFDAIKLYLQEIGHNCAFRRSWAVIPLIVGTPEKRTFWSPSFYAQVVTMGQVLVFREHHDDGAGSPLSNRVGGHFAATGPAPHRPRSVHPSIRANGPQGVG